MSSSHDSRAHVRHDSVAYRRAVPVSPEKKQHARHSAVGGGQSASPTSAPSDRTKHSLTPVDEKDKRQQVGSQSSTPPLKPTTKPSSSIALRVVFVVTLVVFAWHFVSRSSLPEDVEHLAQSRKAKRQGAGESFVLPRRWRNGNATDVQDGLPACKRVLLFKFSSTSGFSSEMNLYLQASVIATKLGYTLLADDTDWNFGHLQAYFAPRSIFCRPPPDWFLPSAATPLGSKRWPMQDRVWYARELAPYGDKWLRDEVLDHEDMASLRGRTLGPVLLEGETLPSTLEDVFVDFEGAIKDVWRPNDELAKLIQRQRMELGLGDGGYRLRKHSPTWGGTRKTEDGSERVSPEDVEDEDEHDYDEAGGAARSDRGPMIGVQLGAKDDGSRSRAAGLDKGQLLLQSRTSEGINDAIRRLTSSSIGAPSYSRTRSLFHPLSMAYVVLVTPNTTAASEIVWTDDQSRTLPIVTTSRPPLTTLRRWNDVLRLELTEDMPAPGPFSQQSTNDKTRKIVTEWDLEAFGALPASLRAELTRFFVRDLTTMSWFSDAFVVHGSTNTGRLACVLAGLDAVVGPRDISGKGSGGRVRSVDGWWYPSSSLEGLWDDGL